MARTESTMLELGTPAPEFALNDVVSGKLVRLADLKGQHALLVLFLCPHCPFVKHIEAAVSTLGHDYAKQHLNIVAISSNDAATYPDDSPEGMRAQAEKLGFNFPYLYDESQEVAKTFQAACTPDLFLFDHDLKLVYRGQFDGSRPGNGVPVTGDDLRRAIDAVLAGDPVPQEQRPSLGCNIKWKN